jgi:hypothetical protein
MPNPGKIGTPCGLFYRDTPEGKEQAAAFTREWDRPGWGVFSTVNPLRDDAGTWETFIDILAANGWG